MKDAALATDDFWLHLLIQLFVFLLDFQGGKYF